MEHEPEQLHDRYLEAQLRETLGPQADFSERVLHAVYAKPPRRVIPGPRRVAAWRPLAAAAAVLIAAGVATYALVQYLPRELRDRSEQAEQAIKRETSQPQAVPGDQERTGTPAPGKGELPKPVQPLPQTDDPIEAEDQPAGSDEPKSPDPKPDDSVSSNPDPSDSESPPLKDWTDPPQSWPDPTGSKFADPRKDLPVIVSTWKADAFKVWHAGNGKGGQRVEAGEEFQIRAGDRVQPKGTAEFTLLDGTLLRVEGELTFARASQITLNDGMLYADVGSALLISKDDVSVSIDGVAVLEERLHGIDVFCISGRVSAGEDHLAAGFRARLDSDGFGRDKAITWDEVQREFKFLKDAPTRTMLVEELNAEPGKLFGGALAEGVLAGDVDSDTGIGFYLREPYSFREGDVVRFRFRVGKACEMILQFGTVEDANWRHKMGGVKAGEWIEYELPLIELYKTTDVALKAAPGLALKFFQLHPEEATARIEIDRVEIVHRP